MRGEPYLVRLREGMRRPKRTIRGVDMAGVVEAVGTNVTQVRAGDEVFGWGRSGALAEVERRRAQAKAPRSLVAREIPAARERRQDPVRGRHRQPGRAGDLARSPVRPVGAEELEHRERSVECLQRRRAVLHRRLRQSLITTMRSSVISRTV
jgi:hypothetical protein